MRESVKACRNRSGPLDPFGIPEDRPHVALLIETSLASGRDILRGIARYVREHEPWALYHEPHGLEESVPRWLRRWKGDGIIARVHSRGMAKQLAASGIPVVDVLGLAPHLPFPLVHVDNSAIGRMAADHLLERGLRHFGFFGIQGESWSEQRYAGFCAAVAAIQPQVPAYQLPRDARGKRSWEHAENKLARWVTVLPKPVGVLVCSDQRGPQFLEACRRAGVSVPDEVAVIGVDNDEPLCEVCLPPLSSIEAAHTSVGYQAAALLESLLRGLTPPNRPKLVEPQGIIARPSTDMLAVTDPTIAAALRLIRERAHTGLKVDAIARHVGLSRSVLQRRFRALLKHSVHQEILAVRIKRARDLLVGTDLPLVQIAERAGFKYQEHMAAVFRARVGKTPGQLRAEADCSNP
jgi:LacI family transcriptional regulator